MPDLKYSLDPIAKTIDFTRAISMDRVSLGDIYQQQKNYGYTIFPPTDTYVPVPGVEPPSQEERQAQLNELNKAYKAYLDLDFNTMGTTMHYLPNTEHNRLAYPDTPKIFPGYSEQPYDTYMDFPQGRVKVQTEGVESENFPYAQTKEGIWMPTHEIIKNGGYLEWTAGDPEKNEPNFFWKEVPDGMYVNAERMRTIFGPEEMDSRWYASMGRSIYAGAWGYTIKGIGGFVGTLGDVISGDVFTGKEKNTTLWNEWFDWSDFEKYMTNVANYNIHRNYDERMGFHDDVNSALWNIFNVMGQAVGIIATSAVTYGAGAGIGLGARAVGAVGVARTLVPRGIDLIGREASALAKISRWSGMALGGAQAGAMQKEEIRKIGGSDVQASRWFWPFFLTTVASENILAFNIIPNIGAKSVGKYFAARPLLLKKAFNTEAKKEIIDGTVPSYIGQQNAVRRMRENFIDWQYKTVNWLDDNKVARYTLLPLLSGGEETIEETAENLGYMALSGIYNTVSEGVADTLHAKYRGINYVPNNRKDFYGGEWLAYDNNGRVLKSLSQEEYEEVEKEKNWLDKFSKGENRLDTKFHGEELISIFLGSMLTGGLGSIMTSRKNKQDDLNAMHVAMAEKKNPSLQTKNDEIGQWFISSGRIGNNQYASTTDTQGNPIKAGQQMMDADGKPMVDAQGNPVLAKSEAQERWDLFRAKVDMYKDLMDVFSLNSKEVLDAVNNNTGLLSKALETAEEIEERKKIASELGEGKVPTSKFFKEGLTVEENKKALDKAQQRMTDLTVAENFEFTANGKKLKGRRSKEYKRAFLASALIENNIDFYARETAKMDSSVINAKGKPEYDTIFNSVYNKKKKDFLTKYNEGKPLFGPFDYLRRYYIESRAFEYTTKDTLAYNLDNYSRAVVEAYNKRLDDMLQEDDTILGTSINTAIAKLEDAIPNLAKFQQMTIDRENMTDEELENINEEDDILYRELNNMILQISDLVNGNKAKKMTSLGEMIKYHNQLTYHKPSMSTTIDKEKLARVEEAFGSLTGMPKEIIGKIINTDTNDFEKLEKIDYDGVANLSNEMKSNVLSLFLNSLKIPDTELNVSIFLAENTQIAESKTALFHNDKDMEQNLNKIEELLDLMTIFFDANLNLLQKKIEVNENIAENSPLVNNDKLKYNQEHVDEVSETINGWKENIKTIFLRLGESKEYIVLDYAKKKVSALSVDLAIIETLDHGRYAEELKDVKELLKTTIKNIGYLLHKGKIDNKAPVRTIKINDKEHQLRDFDDLYLLIVEAYRHDQTLFGQLQRLIESIELEKNKLYDALGGKLDNIIDRIKKELEPKLSYGSDQVVKWNEMVAFENQTLFDNNQSTLDANYSRHNMEIGRNEYFKLVDGTTKMVTKKDATPQLKFFVWQMTTTLNRINKAGQNGNHKFMECYKAIADYQKTIKGQEILTYEQEQVVLHMLMFSEDPNQSFTRHRILNVMGYNGTGKSTVVLRNFFGAKAKLSKNKLKVLFVAPTPAVRKIHENSVKELDTKIDAGHILLHKLNADEVAKYDLVLIDEASLIPSRYIDEKKVLSIEKTILDISDKKVVMTLGDDAQVLPMLRRENGEVKRSYDVSREIFYNSERTYPLTKIWRSSQVSHYNLFRYFREQYLLGDGKLDPLAVRGIWKNSTTTGKLIGLKYFSNEKDIVETFLEDVRTGVNPDDAMLIVLSEEHKQALIKDVPELDKYKSYIRTVEYNIDLILKDEDKVNDPISGASAKRVYVTGILQTEYGNKTTNTIINSANSMMANSLEQAGRAMLTAVSRGKEFIGLIGDVSYNQMSEKTDAEVLSGTVEGDSSVTNDNLWEENNKKGGRFERILIGAEGIQADPPIDNTVQANFSARLLNADREEIRKRVLPFFDKLKGSINDNVNHLTSLLAPDPIQENAFRLEEKRLLRMILDMLIEGASRQEAFDKTLAWITNEEKGENKFVILFNEYKKSEKPYTAESLAGMYLNTVQLSHSLSNMVNTGIAVSGLALPFQHGDQTYFGHPYVLDIIGYEEINVSENGVVTKKIIPVVDIHDLNSVLKDIEPSPYTIRKMGGYIIALRANGIKVNNVYVHNFSTSMKEASTFFITHELTPQDKLKGIEEASKNLEIEAGQSDSYFADESVIKASKRIDHSVHPEYEIGEQLVHENGNLYTIVEKFAVNGKGGLQMINEQTGSIEETTDLSKYSKSEVPFSFSTSFNEAAGEYNRTKNTDGRGALWSSSAVFIDNEGYKKLKNVYHVFDKAGKIVNRLLHARHLMYKYLTEGTKVSKGFAVGNMLRIDPETGAIVGKLEKRGVYDDLVVTYLGDNARDEEFVRAFLTGATELYEFLSREEKVTKTGMDKAVEEFFNIGLNILGHDGLVDYDYGRSEKWNRNGIPLDEAIEKNPDINNAITEYLKTGSEEDLAKIFEDAFQNGKEKDLNRGMLMELNSERMRVLSALKAGKPVKGQIVKMRHGNTRHPVGINKPISFDRFIEEITLSGAEIERDANENIKVFKREGMRTMKVKRLLGIHTPPEEIILHGKKITKTYFNKLAEDVRNFEKLVSDFNSELSKAKKAAEDAGVKLTKAEKKLLGLGVFEDMRRLDGYEFLEANKKVFIEELQNERSPLRNYIYYSSKYKTIELHGNTVQENLKHFKALMKHLKDLVEKEDGSYVTKLRMHIIKREGQNMGLIHDNIEVNGTTFTQSSLYIRAELPSEAQEAKDIEEFYRISVNPIYDLTNEEGLKQIRKLLGDVTDSDVFLSDSFPQGENVLGYLDSAMRRIYMKTFNGKVDIYTPRHEAHHYMMVHLLKPEAYARIITETKELLAKKGLNNTERDALEYLADIFMTGEYKSMHPKNIIKRFIIWLRKVFDIWNESRFDIYSSMVAFDRGFFSSRSERYENFSGVLYNRKDSYSDTQTWERITKQLNYNDTDASLEVQHIMHRYIYRMIANALPNGFNLLNHSDDFVDIVNAIKDDFVAIMEREFGVLGKAKDNKDGTYTVTYFASSEEGMKKRQARYAFWVRKDDQSKLMTSDELFMAKLDEDARVDKNSPWKDIMDFTAEEYKEARIFENESPDNGKFIRKYIMRVLGNMRMNKRGEIVFDFNNLMYFLQAAFGTHVPLDTIMKGRPMKGHQAQYVSVEQMSHKGILSDQLKLIVESVRLRHAETHGAIQKDFFYSDPVHIDMDTIDRYASYVRRSMRREGTEMTMEEFFKRMMAQIKYIGNTLDKDNIYTFVITFGHNPNQVNKRLMDNGLYGYSLYPMVVNDSYRNEIKDKYVTAGLIDASDFDWMWEQKKEGWADLLRALESYIFSETLNVKESVNTQFQTVTGNAADLLQGLSGDLSTELKGNNFNYHFGVNDRISRLLGESKQSKAEKNSGEINRIYFDKEGLYYFEEDKKEYLIYRKSQYTYALNADGKEGKEHILWLFKAAGYNLQGNEYDSIISSAGYDMLAGVFYNIFLGLKVDMMLQDEFVNMADMEPDIDTIRSFTKNNLLMKYYDELMEYYDNNNMSVSSHNVKLTRAGVQYKGLGLPVFSPDDFYKFNLKHVIAARFMSRGYVTDKTQANIEGEYEQTSIVTGYLFDEVADAFGASYPFAINKVKQMTGWIHDMNKNNNLYTRRLEFDGLKNIGGREHKNKALKFGRMTPVDIMAFLETELLNEIRSNRNRAAIPAIMDAIADKSRQPFAKLKHSHGIGGLLFPGIKAKHFKGHMTGVHGMALNYVTLGQMLLSIHDYYTAFQKSKKANWDNIKGISIEQVKLSDYKMDEDYMIIGGKVVPGPAVEMKENPFVSPQFKKLAMVIKKENQKDIQNVIHEIFLGKFKDLEKYLNDIKYDSPLFGPLATITSHLDESIFENLSAEYNNEKNPGSDKRVSDKNLSKWIREKWGENRMNVLVSPDGQWNAFAETLFFGHMLFNESFNPLIRGNSYMYRDMIDYIKRGTGIIAPGALSSRDPKLRKSPTKDRVFIFDNLSEEHGLFGGKVSTLDGAVIIAPWRQERMYHEFGGNLGPIHEGASKTVNFYFNPADDDMFYLKGAMFPISQELMQYDIYHNMVEFMLGKLNDTIFYDLSTEEFVTEHRYLTTRALEGTTSTITILDALSGKLSDGQLLLYEIPNHMDIRKQLVKLLDNNPAYNDMTVAYITTPDTIKRGARKIHRAGTSMKDLYFDKSLNTPENTILVDSNFMRLQQETYQDVEDPYKNIMTQLLYVINALEHNQQIAKNVSVSIAKSVNAAADRIQAIAFNKSERHKFLQSEGLKRLGERLVGTKQQRVLMNNPGFHPDVLRRQHLKTVIGYMDDHIKPEVSGQSYVQAPFLGQLYFDEFGRPFVPRDFESKYYTVEVPKGATKRFINPLGYERFSGTSWEAIQDKKYLEGVTFRDKAFYGADGAQVRYVPAEVLVSFHQFNIFGITADMTMRQAMIARSTVEVVDPLVYHNDNEYEFYTYGLDAVKIREILSKMNVREVFNNLTSGQRNAIFPPQEGLMEYDISELKDITILDNLVRYYVAFNQALDVLAVRIPTTISSSGFTARIVGFVNDTQNTIYHSPLKNILDGSDFDIDALQVYFRKFRRTNNKSSIWDRNYDLDNKDTGNEIFDQMLRYYSDVRNNKLILSRIDMSKMLSRFEAKKKEYNASQLHKYMTMMDVNQSSKRLVGHFANLNQFLFTLAYHADHARRLFVTNKEEFDKIYGKSLFLLSDEKIIEAAEFVTALTNAATDNPKLGGVLGVLNINEATSPVIAGLVLMGYSQDQILDIMEMPSMRALSENFYALRKADSEFNKPTYQIIGENGPAYDVIDKNGKVLGKKYMSEDLVERGLPKKLIRDAAEAGEQMRRLGDIAAIQSREFKSDTQRFFNAYENMRTALGITPEEFMRGREILDPREQAEAFVADTPNAGRYNKNIEQETRIRNAFSIPYIVRNTPKLNAFVNAAAQVNRFNTNSFSAYNKRIFKQVRLLTGIDRVSFNNFYQIMTENIDKFMIAAFVDHLMENAMKPTLSWMEGKNRIDVTYDLSTPNGRYNFISNFPKYVNWLKHNVYTYRVSSKKANAAPSYIEFLHNLSIRKAYGYITHDIVEFVDSAHKTNYEKATYHSSFERLDEQTKQNFRYYQLLLYGFKNPNNSFGDVTDNKSEKMYTEWRKTFDMEKHADFIAADIVRHNVNLLKEVVNAKKKGYLTEVGYAPYEIVGPWIKDDKKKKHYPMYVAIGELRRSRRLVAQFVPSEMGAKNMYDIGKSMSPNPATYEIISFSTPEYINPYYFKFDEQGVPIDFSHRTKAILDLSREDMDTFHEEGEVKVKGYNIRNFLSEDEETDWTKLSKNIVENTIVVIPDNSLALVTYDGGLVLKSTEPRSVQSNISLTHHRIAANLIDYATARMRAMFPGITIRYTTNRDTSNKHPNSIAYFDNEGVLWINTDRVQYDTPLHELSHIVIDAIWNSDPVMKDSLYRQAMNLYNSNRHLKRAIDSYYSDHTFEEKMKEVLSTVIGWKSKSDVRRMLYKMRISASDNVVQNIWDNVKLFLEELADYISSYVRTIFGTEITLDGSIKDLYDSLFRSFSYETSNAPLKIGDTVFNDGNVAEVIKITKNYVQLQQYSFGKKPISGGISVFVGKDNIQYLKKVPKAFSYITSEEYAELLNGREHFQRVSDPAYDGRTPEINNTTDVVDHLLSNSIYTGKISRDIDFEQEFANVRAGVDRMGEIVNKGISIESEDFRDAINERVARKRDERKAFDEGIIDWLNKGADINVFEDQFPTKDKTLKFKWDNIRKLKTAIHYKSTTKYVHYSDLKDMDGYKHLYSEEMEGYNPIVAIEYVDDKQKVIRIYDLTYDEIDPPTMRNRKDNIAYRYVGNTIAKQLGISFGNDLVNMRMFLTGLTASHMMAKDSKVKVIDMGLMQARRASENFPSYWVDPIRFRNTLHGLGKIQEFVDRIKSKDILNLLNSNIRVPDVDYINLLRYYYDNMNKEDIPLSIKTFKDSPDMDLKEINTLLTIRLITLLKMQKETIDTGKAEHDIAMEIEMITNAMISMRTTRLVDGTLNTFNSLGLAENWIFDSASIGNEAVQIMRNVTLNSSRSVVSKVMEWKDLTHGQKGKHNGLYDLLMDVYHRQNPGKERLMDVTGEMFEPLMAKIQDTEGNWRNTGFIYWTKDENVKGCDTELQKYFARRAKELNIDDDLIKVGAALAQKTEDMLVKLIKHYTLNRTSGYGFWNKEEERIFNDDDVRKELLENSGYIKGMIPILPKRGAEYMKEMNIVKGFMKRFHEITDPREMDDHSMIVDYPDDAMDTIHDRFFNQFGWRADPSGRTTMGMANRLKLIGLKQVLIPGKTEGKYEVAFESDLSDNTNRNEEMSYDMEKVMDYFVMTVERVVEYESNVLPLVNGLKVMLQDMNDGWQVDTKEAIKYMNSFTKQAIQGTRERVSKGDYKLEAGSMALMSTISPLVMTFNINVAAVGSISAGMLSFMEAISNSINKDKFTAFTASDLIKANAYVFANWSVVGQLMKDYGIMNMSEYDLLAHRTRQKTKKHPFSSYVSNWMNWSSDYFARGVIMTAMMIHDDSLKAYSVNKDNRTIVYDEKKDGQFFNEKGEFKSEEAQAYYYALKRKLIKDGIHGQEEDKPLKMGYDKDMSRRFKFYADKYAIGAYDNQTRSRLANYVLGRYFTMFSTWLSARIANSFSGDRFLRDGGKYVMVKDNEGKWLMEWEQLRVEGWVNTVFKTVQMVTASGGFNNLKYMTDVQKRNWRKMVVAMSIYTLMFMLYRMLVDDDKDKDDMGVIPNWRIIRNFKYATQSMFVIPNLVEKLNNPIPAARIIRNTFFDYNGNMRIEFPSTPIIETYIEPFEEES